MTVAITLTDGRYSFTERSAHPILVDVPEGSELLPVSGFGRMLFVPVDRLVRRGWNAAEVLRAARHGRFRFA